MIIKRYDSSWPVRSPEGRWMVILPHDCPKGMEDPEHGCAVALVYGRTKAECERRAKIVADALEKEETDA